MTDCDIEELTGAFVMLSLHDQVSFQAQALDAEVHRQTDQIKHYAALYDNNGEHRYV